MTRTDSTAARFHQVQNIEASDRADAATGGVSPVIMEVGHAGSPADTARDGGWGTFIDRKLSRDYRNVVLGLVPDEEYQALKSTHRELVKRKFVSGLSKKEVLELRMLRWQLDRLEDARTGGALDGLESLVLTHEFLSRNVLKVAAEAADIIGASPPSRKHK